MTEIDPKSRKPVNTRTGKTLSWQSHGLTHAGRIREHNEDAFLDRSEIGLWAVADGMGGHDAGDVASQLIIEQLRAISARHSLTELLETVENSLLTANRELLEKASAGSQQLTIGSTVIAFIACHDRGAFIWAGDSRLYQFRDRQLRQLTTDHSQVELYIARGLISREEASHHPHSNMITRAVGAADELCLDTGTCDLRSGDRFLLCSDGLTRHADEQEIRDILATGAPAEAAGNLMELAMNHGGTDNITTLVIDII